MDKTGKRKSPFKWLMIFSVIFGLQVAYVWQHITVESLAGDIDRINKENQTLKNTNEQLKSDISKLSSYGRIQKVAIQELGLIFPSDKPLLLVVDYDERLVKLDKSFTFDSTFAKTQRVAEGQLTYENKR